MNVPKLDAGSEERLMLVSRDERNCLVVSYKEVKTCIENAYRYGFLVLPCVRLGRMLNYNIFQRPGQVTRWGAGRDSGMGYLVVENRFVGYHSLNRNIQKQ